MEQELLRRCAEEYGRGGFSGLENFFKEYEGLKDEKNYLEKLIGVLTLRNGNGRTRVVSLHGYNSLKEIVLEGIEMKESGLSETLEEYL